MFPYLGDGARVGDGVELVGGSSIITEFFEQPATTGGEKDGCSAD
jgi:hypothetical protein